jgi:tubulin polyglutamylase TTLL6/13
VVVRARVLTSLCKLPYLAVCRVAKRFGLKPAGDEDDWSIFWTDSSVFLERAMDLRRYQVMPFL